MKFYVDTSVCGGYDDDEFEEWTVPFFEQAKQGRFIIVLSDVTLREIEPAPPRIRELAQSIPDEHIELVSLTEEQDQLAQRYVQEGALTEKFKTDSQHIAMATILKV